MHTIVKSTSTGSRLYTNLGLRFSLQIGCQEHNHTEGKDKQIKAWMSGWMPHKLQMDMPECISMAEIQQALSQNNHLQQLKGIIITGWPDSRGELHADLQPYWSYWDKLAVIDGIILGRCIIMPNSLREQVLNQLHTNHMGREKIKATGP